MSTQTTMTLQDRLEDKVPAANQVKGYVIFQPRKKHTRSYNTGM
jgi:hypothetical protein